MPIDNYKPKGPTKASKLDSGGMDVKNYPIIGIVKDNVDPLRSGRIRVALQDGKGPVNPDDSSSWVSVNYLSTFFGSVKPNSGNDTNDYGSYKGNPSSYGQWQSPPDIGTKVVCIFINGDLNAGYYIGAIPEPETLHMVPALGASEKVTVNENEAVSLAGAPRLPTTNINTNNPQISESDEFLEEARPVHSYAASIMSQQGIIRDPIRGPISSSASRETVSRVGWGVSTPGRPIYEGGFDDSNLPDNLDQSNAEKLKIIARRGGHSIVMDDGDIIGRDQLIRIRTALGHQILMSDDGQTLMILHSNGQSYIELGKEGTVDIYSTNSINMRTEGDFNIHADRDINLHAKENFNFRGKNININSEEEVNFKSGKDFKLDIGQNYTAKVKSAIALNASGQASFTSNSQTFINGSRINLNSGNASLKAPSVNDITLVAHTDTLFDQEVGWTAAPGELLSITSRAPAHCPWVGAGLGVDIKNSPAAKDKLPQPASDKVAQINKEAEATPPLPIPEAATATTPEGTTVSKTINKRNLSSLLGATSAITGFIGAKKATKSSAGITNKNPNAVYGINSALQAAGNNVRELQEIQPINPTITLGVYDREPKSLVTSGVLKPGADTLINTLAKSNKSVSEIIPRQLYTGLSEAENTTSFVRNLETQTTSVVNSMKVAQKQLIEAGLLHGNESITQTGGILSAAAILGTDDILELANKKVVISENNITNSGNKLLTLISSVNLSVKQEETSGVLAGISNTINIMNNNGMYIDTTLGASAGAYELIKKSFGVLTPGIPQNLSRLAKNTVSTAFSMENNFPTLLGNKQTTKISATFNNNSIESIVGEENTIINNISGTINTIGVGTLPQFGKQFNNIDSLLSSVSTNSLNKVSNSISAGIDFVNTLSGTTASLSDGIIGLSNAAKNIKIGNISNKASQLASGISNLPGGLDNLASTSNLLSDGIKNINFKSSISNIKSGITNAIKNALPVGSFSSLLSSIGGIGKAGKSPIKLPSFSSKTRDRNAQDIQISKIINDPGIPKPNFSSKDDPILEQKLEQAKLRLQKLQKNTTETTTK
jgi:hypothetical protein